MRQAISILSLCILLALGVDIQAQTVSVTNNLTSCALEVTLYCGDADCNSSACTTLCVSGSAGPISLCGGCGDWTYFTVCAASDAVCSGVCTGGSNGGCVTVSPNGCLGLSSTGSFTTTSACGGCPSATVNVDASTPGSIIIN